MTEPSANRRGPDAVTHQLPAGELPAGWKLLEGQYEIVRLIASGGFGITYLARDTLGRDVAVKECFPLGLAQRASMTHTVSATSAGTSEHFETARGQFLREARMLARLRHPNVVHVQTLFEENGTAYMAMDFIHGRDLHEELAGDALTPTRVLDLARDLLGALAYIHEKGVLHRDIKPQNIRIDAFGMPMLIDFGAARAETQARSRMAGTFRVVTDGYSPHEFYVSGAKQGPHSDLYALAATLHHVITGAAPIAADERASAMATGQPDPYTPIAEDHPAHDRRLLQLIDRALRMVPADRPADAAAWLAALTDARTTIVTPPVEATEPHRSRLLAGVALGALIMAGAGAGIWVAQPEWLSPGMEEMQAQVSTLETRLAEVTAERGEVAAALTDVEGTLAEAEENLRLLSEPGEGTAQTLTELNDAIEARNAAAAQADALRAQLEELTAAQALRETEAAETQAEALARQADDAAAEQAQMLAEQAQVAEAAIAEAEREALALAAQITELEAANVSARARVTTLEASLADATIQMVEARTNAALLTRAEAELGEVGAALNAATIRAATLEAQLEQARAQAGDLEAVQTELAASEAAREALAAEMAAMVNAAEPGIAELAELRTRIAALEAENAGLAAQIATAEVEAENLRATMSAMEGENGALSGALETAEAALADALRASLAGREEWAEQANLRAPNGTFALLPRFSWDNRRIAAVDSTGGIALFDRSTGGYEAHLARGIPDRVLRLGFSAGGSYLIATTPDGTPNRLYDVQNRREILRFEPVTVTTAIRAISRDEQHFVFTRAGNAGQVDIIVTSLPGLSTGEPSERILSRVPDGTPVRIAFSETSNQINILTPTGVRIFNPDGQLLRTGPNSIGQVAALSPLGGDQGFLILRNDGEVRVYNDLIAQEEIATVEAQDQYSLYRLSGDRLNFLRANDTGWDVIDLRTGALRGSGPIEAGTEQAHISLSADGGMVFIGATQTQTARLLDVATGLELRDFGDATQGYFSFDNIYLATGRADGSASQIWRVAGAEDDAPDCPMINRAMDGIPILPNALTRARTFAVEAGGDIGLLSCAPDQALAAALIAGGHSDLSVSQAPDVAINMLGTAQPYGLEIAAEGDCTPTIVARFGEEWSVRAGAPVTFTDMGDTTRALDVWLATPDGVTCDARIMLSEADAP